MARFIEINSTWVNVDHIVRVEQRENDIVSIQLDNGGKIDYDGSLLLLMNDIRGWDHVVAITPCEGVFAIMDSEEKELCIPVRQLAVTASGDVRALEVSMESIEFYDEMEFFRGLTYEEF